MAKCVLPSATPAHTENVLPHNLNLESGGNFVLNTLSTADMWSDVNGRSLPVSTCSNATITPWYTSVLVVVVVVVVVDVVAVVVDVDVVELVLVDVVAVTVVTVLEVTVVVVVVVVVDVEVDVVVVDVVTSHQHPYGCGFSDGYSFAAR
jgi:hypothetical protein